MKIHLTENSAAARSGLLADPRYRPFIGISVSSRLPPLDKVVQILGMALQTPYPIVPLLVADDIAYINYRAFKHYSSGNCIKKVQRDAELHIALWHQALAQFPAEQAKRVRFVHWQEILTPDYVQRQSIVREDFKRGDTLYRRVLLLAESFILHSGKTVTEQRCRELSEYVIQELPLLLFGIDIDGVRYRRLLYPAAVATPVTMQSLIVAIRRHPEFAALRTRLSGGVADYANIVQIIFSDRHDLQAGSILPGDNRAAQTPLETHDPAFA